MTVLPIEPPSPSLPPLRQELRIDAGAALVNGAPSWTLFDPLRHAFFQLGKIEFRIFSRWAQGSFEGLSEELVEEGVPPEDVDATVARVVDFSLANHLTLAPMGDVVATLTKEREAQRKAWWRWMVDNYLFFRIPLVKPAGFLKRTIGNVAPLWSPASLWFFAGLALLGLFLVSRQWDAFTSSFLYFFSWEGLLAYGVGLFAVKIAHELGHAYTATRFGCTVPTMGVSFLVMFPVLYTDTTAAWRLTSRKQKLAIDCAGVTAELMVASVATLLWVILPEGSLRSICFILATSSWIMSLGVNLNPFMRFDGYYVLADLLDVPNLQPRAFALGRWRLRELLFATGEAPPEEMPSRLRRGLIAYAWITWIYRLILFTGIAVLVYTMFFKALGIILFLVEIGVFVARPIMNELKLWWSKRSILTGTSRGRYWPYIIGSLLLLGILPLDRHVSAPAILAPMGSAPLVAGNPARIEKLLVRNGEEVRAGAVIAELSAPELDQGISARQAKVRSLEEQLARGASDERDLAARSVLERELSTERTAVSGLGQMKDRLILRAPIAGKVVDLDSNMHAGRWLGGDEVVARIVTPGKYDIQAYLDEDSIWRLPADATGRFVANDPLVSSRPAKLVERGTAALRYLDQPMLASVNGGAIATDTDEEKRLRPRTALYRVRFITPIEQAPTTSLPQPVTGQLSISATPQSWFGLLARRFMRVFRSEASTS